MRQHYSNDGSLHFRFQHVKKYLKKTFPERKKKSILPYGVSLDNYRITGEEMNVAYSLLGEIASSSCNLSI